MLSNKSLLGKKAVLIALIISLLSVLFAYQYFSRSTDAEKDIVQTPSASQTDKTRLMTIEKKWVEPTQASNQVRMASALPFTQESVFNALKQVRVDENGELILDHIALISLDETLERIHDQLDANQLASLLALIEASLPGITGEQTAKLVEDYYYFLGAKDEFSASQEAKVAAVGENAEFLDDNLLLYQELKALRAIHLGNETAQSLFRVSDAAAAFMFSSMQLAQNTQLSQEQLIQKQQALQDKQIRDALNISNWDARFASYKEAKQAVLDSSLDSQTKTEQIMQLLRSEFNAREIEKMQYFGLDATD